jgi:hypothetical protein
LPLTYAIGVPPLAGSLSGAAPALTYTPAEGFTGYDRFAFTVSNGVSDSRPAHVTIRVLPSPADAQPPVVIWTHPPDGAALENVSRSPIVTDQAGSRYAPAVVAVFSEAMDPATIDAGSMRLEDGAGDVVQAAVAWDGAANQAILTPLAAWRDGPYTATVTGAARDASGNPLLAEVAWSFRIATFPGACAGDCDGNGAVTVNELIRGVNIALGTLAVSACPSFDASGDGRITVDELIAAVNRALGGCPAS